MKHRVVQIIRLSKFEAFVLFLDAWSHCAGDKAVVVKRGACKIWAIYNVHWSSVGGFSSLLVLGSIALPRAWYILTTSAGQIWIVLNELVKEGVGLGVDAVVAAQSSPLTRIRQRLTWRRRVWGPTPAARRRRRLFQTVVAGARFTDDLGVAVDRRHGRWRVWCGLRQTSAVVNFLHLFLAAVFTSPFRRGLYVAAADILTGCGRVIVGLSGVGSG